VTSPRPFAVDLDDLDATVALLTDTERAFDERLDDVRRAVAHLHLRFEGLSAQAHLAAQQEWEGGFARMREALGELRAAARGAHDNYRGAVEVNLRMWSH